KLEPKEIPDAGFWPAWSCYPKRQGGVASSRRADPGYARRKKTRRRAAVARRNGRRPHQRGGREGGGRAARHALPLGTAAEAALLTAASCSLQELAERAGSCGRATAPGLS